MDQAYIESLQQKGIRFEVVRKYKDLHKIRDGFIVGHNGFQTNFLLIVGAPGSGKSFQFRTAKNAYYANDAVSAIGLYRMAWRNLDKPLILDDVDDLLRDRQVVALLKALGEPGKKQVSWEKQNMAPKADKVPLNFFTSSRVCIICNELPRVNRNVQAVLDRAKTVVFWPTAEEIHEFVGTWWPEEHADVREFIGQNLDKITRATIRWYEDAVREKQLGIDWRDWLLRMWYSENPRMAVIAEMFKNGIPRGKPMEEEWHRRTGLCRALFYRLQKEYLAQHEQPSEPPEAPPDPEKP